MTNADDLTGPDRPTEYLICIRGVLDASWSARLEGLHIEVQYSADGFPTTLLSGPLEDQASLNGVLAALYGLGFSLLSVTAL